MQRDRNSKRTRQAILQSAFDRIHGQGFQNAGLAEILAETGVTKGALYHHFPNKLALGYAVIDELLRDYVEHWWLDPLEGADDPIDALARLIQERLSTSIPGIARLGCPLNNLAQEMSAVDEGFRHRIENLYRMWRKRLARALRHGQQHGTVRGDIDTKEAATFIIAVLEGAFGQAKAAQNSEVFQVCMGGLSQYLKSLRI